MSRISNVLLRVGLWTPYLSFWRALCWLRRPHIYIGDQVVLTRTLFGHLIYVDASDLNIAPSLLMRGIWEPHVTRALLAELRPGMRYVEVGSNCGYFTLLAGERVGPQGRGFAFDANRRLVDLTRRSLRVNGMYWMSVEPSAVSDRCGTAALHVRAHELGSANLYTAKHPDSDPSDITQAETIEVPITTLDDFFAADPAPVDVLRIDAEGSEPAILRGARKLLARSPNAKILLEFYPRMLRAASQDPRAFLESLAGDGYRIREITPRGVVSADVGELAARTDALADLLLDRP